MFRHKMRVRRIDAGPMKWIAMCPCGEVKLYPSWWLAIYHSLTHYEDMNVYTPRDF